MQLNPARGRKLIWMRSQLFYLLRFMQLNPARGRKRRAATAGWSYFFTWFMQLNPARGRKQESQHRAEAFRAASKVYAAQPREGTETISSSLFLSDPHLPWFMQLNPARGRKQVYKELS